MMRKIGSINGFILGVLCIFGAFVYEGGSLKALFLLAPLLVVFGGTFAAVIVGFGLDKVANIFKLMRIAYFPREYNVNKLIDTFFEMSVKARREGLLVLEKDLDKFEFHFPRKLLRFAIDGTSVDSLETMAQLEMQAMQDRHFSNAFLFIKMGGYAPTMGILGTVMALIMTLANAGKEPQVLINNIATAFIATLWGVLSANLLWLPIGDKLKKCHLEEKHMMEISLEGAIALQNGEIPMILKARLVSMLPQKEQLKIAL
jgi:chemotaxis protein MotA